MPVRFVGVSDQSPCARAVERWRRARRAPLVSRGQFPSALWSCVRLRPLHRARPSPLTVRVQPSAHFSWGSTLACFYSQIKPLLLLLLLSHVIHVVGSPSTSPCPHCHPLEFEGGRQCGRRAASVELSLSYATLQPLDEPVFDYRLIE